MKEKRMIKHRQFFIWNYDEEMKYLDKMSEEGWQLVYKKAFHSEFVKDESVTYKYQIDYNNDENDKQRYLEMFSEQGWENIDSKTGQKCYFRKKYDETLPKEEYEIYTDKETKKQMFSDWLKFIRIILCIYIVGAILNFSTAAMAIAIRSENLINEIIKLVLNLSIIGLMGCGYINIKRVINDKKKLPKLILVVLIVLLLGSFCAHFVDFYFLMIGAR